MSKFRKSRRLVQNKEKENALPKLGCHNVLWVPPRFGEHPFVGCKSHRRVVERQSICWVQVSAVDGQVLHSGLLRDGQALDIDHAGPLNLVIGDRSAVTTIRFQGNPVTLPPQSQSGVVRLRLGE